MISPSCRDCVTAAWVLRRIGFKDSIVWGHLQGPNEPRLHAFHSNSDRPKLFPPTTEKQADGRMVVTEPEMVCIGNDPLPLCSCYRSELAWLCAGRPTRLTVYMAHPVAGDFERNVASAVEFFRYLRKLPVMALSELTGVYYEVKPLILCPWLAGIERDELHPGGRDGALADCKETVLMFDEMWMVKKVTDGMHREAAVARVVRDLTHLKLPRRNGHN